MPLEPHIPSGQAPRHTPIGEAENTGTSLPLVSSLAHAVLNGRLNAHQELGKDKTVLVYHDTPVENLKWIFRFGLYLSTATWTVGHRPQTLDDPHYGFILKTKITLALRLDSSSFSPADFGHLIRPDGNAAQLPPELRAHLARWDRLYSPNDKYFDSSFKPFRVRNIVYSAHRLLEEERNGTLRHFDLSHLDADEMKKINKGNPNFETMQTFLEEFSASGEKPICHPSDFAAGWRDRALDLLTFLYRCVPEFKSPGLRRHEERQRLHEQILARAAKADDDRARN